MRNQYEKIDRPNESLSRKWGTSMKIMVDHVANQEKRGSYKGRKIEFHMPSEVPISYRLISK